MTTDSFFSARNQFDAQIAAQEWQPATCEGIIEAAARRMAQVEGTYTAAVRIQRIADICAGANVQPIETWARVEASIEPDVVDEAPRSRLRRFWDAFSLPLAYLLGVAVGFGMGLSP